MNPHGRFHELGCQWVEGAQPHVALEGSYKTMPASQVPAGKKHCSHC